MDKFPSYIQVRSPLEFTRLVCALERSPRVSFLHEHKGAKVLSVQMDLLKQSPVIYYTPVENFNHYLCYGFKSGKEESLMVDSTVDTSKMYSPIVKIKSLPQSLKPSPENNTAKYQPIELDDLGSLRNLVMVLKKHRFHYLRSHLRDSGSLGFFLISMKTETHFFAMLC